MADSLSSATVSGRPMRGVPGVFQSASKASPTARVQQTSGHIPVARRASVGIQALRRTPCRPRVDDADPEASRERAFGRIRIRMQIRGIYSGLSVAGARLLDRFPGLVVLRTCPSGEQPSVVTGGLLSKAAEMAFRETMDRGRRSRQIDAARSCPTTSPVSKSRKFADSRPTYGFIGAVAEPRR